MKTDSKEVYFICLFGKEKLGKIPMGSATSIKRKAMDEYKRLTGNIAINDYACFDLTEEKFDEIMAIINRYDDNFSHY